MTGDSPSARPAREQFGRQAAYYAESAAHRSGEGLDALVEYVSLDRYETAVDIGTGAGFTAFAVAPYARWILATDIAPGMLAQAQKLAKERGISNLGLAMLEAESLPFASNSLDAVTCRQAAHHFYDLPGAVGEIRRVLKPGGVFIFTDPAAPEENAPAQWMNDVEVRRDPTHVKDLKGSEWRSLLDDGSFRITHWTITKVYLEFNDWVQRAATAEENIGPLRRDFLSASPSLAATFGIRSDGEAIHFYWDVLVMRAVKG